MLKKLSAFAFLGTLAVLTLSAFNSVGSQPVTRFGFSLGLSEFNVSLPSNSSVSDAGTNFRIAHTWNGYFIPSMDVTGLLDLPIKSANLSATGGGVSRQYEYGPALRATGFAAVSLKSPHAPLSEIFALFPVPAKVPAKVIAQQYEYGPALRATGFAAPRPKWNSGH
jgi:hypothetical protein